MAPHYEEGTYRGLITEQGFDESKYGLQFWIKFRLDGERERTAFLSLTDEKGNRSKFADKSLEVLLHLGFPGGDGKLSVLDPRHPSCFSFVDREAEFYCSHKRRDDGTVVERWYVNTPRTGMETTPPERDSMRRLDALFGKTLRDAAKAAPKPAAPKPAVQPPAPRPADEQQAIGGEDAPAGDIPF